MKTYVFELTVREGMDEWWEKLQDKTGCEEVQALIEDYLFNIGLNVNLTLINYKRND